MGGGDPPSLSILHGLRAIRAPARCPLDHDWRPAADFRIELAAFDVGFRAIELMADVQQLRISQKKAFLIEIIFYGS
jgi:hypothetical protein